MKKLIITIAFLVIFVIALAGIWLFIPLPLPITGGKMTNVVIHKHSRLSDDGTTLAIRASVSSSAGYIKTYRTKQDGDKLYITFYSTFGLNNPNGANSEFDIDVTGINYLYNEKSEGHYLEWKRDNK